MASAAGFGQRRHGHAVRVGARGPPHQLLQQRMRAVGQLQQADVGDDAEAAFDQRQAARSAGSRPACPRASCGRRRTGSAARSGRSAGRWPRSWPGRPARRRRRPRPAGCACARCAASSTAVARPPICTSRSLRSAAQRDGHGQRQAQRHQQGELRIVGDGQHHGRHGQRDEDGVPGRLAEQRCPAPASPAPGRRRRRSWAGSGPGSCWKRTT